MGDVLVRVGEGGGVGEKGLRSAVVNCWPFWRARIRGSVILRVVEVKGQVGSG